ncbi:hypothetical protein BG005_001330, partial [Podila minutissima]
VAAQKGVPQHVHLSNHPGYELKHPLAFFLVYGDYVLRILRMVKRGNVFDILWGMNCDGHLSSDNIDLLVRKAIAHLSQLQELSSNKWSTNFWPSRCHAAWIKIYLDVQEYEKVEGNLHRYISGDQKVYWVCPAHNPQNIGKESLRQLENFVRDHGGNIDMQQATLRVELGSAADADQFRALLTNTKRTFDISVQLKWKATRSDVKGLCLDIAKTNAVILEIDGIACDVHPQDHVQYTTNIIADRVTRVTDLKLVRLLNYPRPLEQCLYFGKFEVQLRLSPTQSVRDWVKLKIDLEKFGEAVSETRDLSKCKVAAKTIRSALAHQKLPDITNITIYNGDWDGVFDLHGGVFVEVHSSGTCCPAVSAFAGSLQRLTQDIYNEKEELELYRLVEKNIGLEALRISTAGRNVLHQVERISQLWPNSRSPLNLTLLERMQDTRARVVAQVVIGGEIFECLHWDCDHIFSPLSDYEVAFVDLATQQHPSVLTLLTLDVSRLSRIGFACIEKVLRRSSLEHLHVICGFVPSQLSRSVSQILGSIRWTTLKSLALTGDNIEKWLQLWPSAVSQRLLRLEVQGTELAQQELSHSTVLFIHRLIFMSPLVEIFIEEVLLQDKRDWALIVEGMDPSLSKTFGLYTSSYTQFMSSVEAVDLFNEKIATVAASAKWTLSVFTLDLAVISNLGITRILNILRHCNLRHLWVMCTPLDDPSLSDPVAQVLNSAQWSTLESLELSGENIDEWIRLIPRKVVTARLKYVYIYGAGSSVQELSQPSALFVRQLVSGSPLEELHLQGVLLEHMQDWVHVIKSMDRVLLKSMYLCESSRSQLLSCTDAMDLFYSKMG